MKNTIKIITAIILFISFTSKAQDVIFHTQGEIEFEKRVNTFARLKWQVDSVNWTQRVTALQAYLTNEEQFLVQKSTLVFNSSKSFFKPTIGNRNIALEYFGRDPLFFQVNVIEKNFDTQTSITQKDVLNNFMVIKEPIKKIDWKFTDEVRDILGYQTRRANAIVNDSIYVVAFYTDQITIASGPENFGGLPGMILGLALPHENVSWFATKITTTPVPETKFQFNPKGKNVSREELEKTIKALRGDIVPKSVYLKGFLM